MTAFASNDGAPRRAKPYAAARYPRGIAILLVEQYYDFAQELADDYLVMQRGEFIARGRGADMQEKGVRQMVSI